MSRRGRSIGFLVAALLAAATAAAVADGYGDSVVAGYGELRPVVVAASNLEAGSELDPVTVAEQLEVRRVPVRFAPPGALGAPTEAVGMVPTGPVPAGSYLLAGQLRPPRRDGLGPRLGNDRRPVEIAVRGAGALSALGVQPVGSKVDVVVTSEPAGSGGGRTYVAAAAVPLLGLGPAGEGAVEGTTTVTLGLTRSQALRLIDAESFARRVTVIPSR
ncbi:MAG TPA: Flp pilus assembly protein CpaB [Solirubrobacterales bacterium]|nr:Flp pilus assembly protein CpaB [Solirubrobacterales bacterium]